MHTSVKMIKLDLNLNGVKITNLDELQDNFSADILPIFQVGRLAKWFKSRELPEQAAAIEAIRKDASELEQLKGICQVLGLDDDEEVLQFLLDDRAVAQSMPAAVEIEAKPEFTPAANLDELFLVVPETTLPNGTVVPSFQVARYVAAKTHIETLHNIVTVPILDAEPWVEISFDEAIEACDEMGGSLITETQWLAIAHDVAHQDCNWTGGKVGVGDLFQGLRNGNVSSPQPGAYVSTDLTEQRWLTLSNGEKICDLNGNVYQWVFDDVQGDDDGDIMDEFDKSSATLITPRFRNGEHGLGTWPKIGDEWGAGSKPTRGGCGFDVVNKGGFASAFADTTANKSSGTDAGVFHLAQGTQGHTVGFRCTRGGPVKAKARELATIRFFS